MTTVTAPRPKLPPLEGELRPGTRSSKRQQLTRVAFGRNPIGMIFGAPYALFIALLFAYPLFLAVWISFHSYFFTAPGVSVPRPFVGWANYAAVLNDCADAEAASSNDRITVSGTLMTRKIPMLTNAWRTAGSVSTAV